MNFNTKSKNLEIGSDEVEEMLREAQDGMLLKLSVGSHMARLSSNLPPDLESRFQSLKSGSSTNSKPEKSTPKVTSCDTTKVRDQYPVLSGNDDDDDLFARFAALKSSLPQPSTSSSLSLTEHIKLEDANQTSGLNSTSSSAAMEESSLVDESEVEKIIQWAIDAARLDPSPQSDDDNDVDNTSNDDNVSESGSSDEEDDKLKKGKRRVCK